MTFYMDTIPDEDLINRNFEFVYDIIGQISDEAILYNTQFSAIKDEVNEYFSCSINRKTLISTRRFNSLNHKMNAISEYNYAD